MEPYEQPPSHVHGRGPERIASEMRAKVILAHADDEPPASVMLRDISLDGAAIVYSRDLAGGTRVLLQLPASHGTTLSLHAHVVQSRVLEAERYRIGLQFDVNDSVAIARLRDTLLL
jgi:hypothetical protein